MDSNLKLIDEQNPDPDMLKEDEEKFSVGLNQYQSADAEPQARFGEIREILQK